MLNYKQFKQKKKREVDPNAPPRPNLLTHEKRMKESQIAFDELQSIVQQQADEIRMLKSKYNDMQNSVSMLINYIRQNR
jgi:DNA-binding transcriptional regulator GbsR (MarR family)